MYRWNWESFVFMACSNHLHFFPYFSFPFLSFSCFAVKFLIIFLLILRDFIPTKILSILMFIHKKLSPFSWCVGTVVSVFVYLLTWIIAKPQRNFFKLLSSQICIFSHRDFGIYFLINPLPHFLMTLLWLSYLNTET